MRERRSWSGSVPDAALGSALLRRSGTLRADLAVVNVEGVGVDEALLTLRECVTFLERGELPNNVVQRAEALRSDRDFRGRWPGRVVGPAVRQGSPTLTDAELELFLAAGEIPDDFADRCRDAVAAGACSNCDGVRDMNLVLRVLDDEPSPCPMCCDPATGELVTVPAGDSSPT